MSSRQTGVVGILAGGGNLPREIAEAVVARGGAVHVVALEGEADADFSAFPVTPVGWAQIGGMLRALKSAEAAQLVIVGSVTRPDLGALRPDLGFLLNLPAILRIITAGGDDSVLTRVVRFFEGHGFHVVGPATVAPALVVGAGPLGRNAASPEAEADIARGLEVVRALGPFDVGQAVVVAQGRVEAIEGAEGTDAMLARVAAQRLAKGGSAVSSGVLVKRPKPGQELRIDMPAIGPATVEAAVEAGLAGIAVLAGATLAAHRPELVSLADARGLFVQGVEDALSVGAKPAAGDWQVGALTERKPDSRQTADATKAAALLQVLAPLVVSAGAVVDRGHVLAVESGEGTAALIARGGSLRQWGRRRGARASGVAVLRDAADIEPSLAGTAVAGLAGLALVGQPAAPLRHAVISEQGKRLGLFVAVLAASMGKA
jgi:UDP-2,3-diacylglucosamine hydrolase